MHYTSFAIRLAYSFQIPGGKGTLGGSPARRRRRGGGRGGGAETCSVKAMGAQTMARFSAGVLSQLWATAQKTQTNEEAEASGADPGSGAREARGVAADPPHPAAQREAWGWQCPSRVPLGLSAARPAVPGAGWLCLPCSPWEAAFITEARSGGAWAQGSEQALQTAAAAGRLRPNPGRARVVLATAAPRQSSSFQGSGWCARAGVRACVCPDTHVPPTQACSYLLAEAATGAMAAKDAEPADRAPHGGTAARARERRMATEGQEARQPPRLGLITKLPQVRAQILSGFSFSRQTPCGGAGTLARAQRLDIYIFLGWFLSLAGKETNP